MNWSPLGEDPSTHAALVDGIPPWMLASVSDWVRSEFTLSDDWSGPAWNIERMRRYDMAARVAHSERLRTMGANRLFASLSDDEAIRLLDWLVYDNASEYGGDDNDVLEAILIAAGSKWRVGTRNGTPGLEERVPAGVQTAVDAVTATYGQAGQLLSEAWHAAFGVNPDHEKAYAKAIKAVEAAAVPVVSAANKSATLGSVVSQMRQQGDWRLALTREHNVHASQHVVLGMMQTLWTGQNDRHAGQTGYMPSTPAEAEAAVLLAVPLVQWFSSGAIQRRP